jgi:hypothetical protein
MKGDIMNPMTADKEIRVELFLAISVWDNEGGAPATGGLAFKKATRLKKIEAKIHSSTGYQS